MWGRLESWRGRVHPKAVERSGRARKSVFRQCTGARFCVLSSSACKMQSAVNRAEYHTITLRSRHDERRLKNRQILTQGPSQSARRTHISLIWLFLRSLRLHVHVSHSAGPSQHIATAVNVRNSYRRCVLCVWRLRMINTPWRLKTVSVRVSVSAVFYAFHLKNEASVNVCEVLLFTCARFRSTCWCEKRE